MGRAHGIDLSKWDISFDPDKATGQIDFVIQKASEGTFRDNKFGDLWAGVQKVPIRGAYHYLRSGMGWQAQADFFISVVKGFDFHFYALDYEGTSNTLNAAFADMAHKWMDYVTAKAGKPVLLYTNPSHYDADLYPYGDWMKDFPLWLAQYWNDPSPDKDPGTPKKRKTGDWTIWQWASEVNYPGHAKEYGTPANNVDLNVFNGTVADMRAWLKLGEAPIQPTTTPTSADAKAAQLAMIDWMIAQLTAKKKELSDSSGPVGD